MTLLGKLTAVLLTCASGLAAQDVPPPIMPAVPTYIEETATSGITSIYAGDWQYMVGGGVAAFDCNADSYADLYFAGGAGLSQLYTNHSAKAGPLQFTQTPSGAEMEAVTGAYPLDIDSDGITDLVILRVGENVVMRGLGDCRFERANEAWGFDGGDGWSTAFSATWEHGAAWPTLAVGNYINRAEEAFPWGSCTDNWLHRGQVGGAAVGFAPPLPLTPSFCALSMLFTDWNRSGTPSLRVSNDREYYKGGQEQLWHLDPGADPVLYTPAEGWKPLRIWGMGIASYDIDSNGYPEYFLTSMADNKLQRLVTDTLPVPAFADVAFAAGVTAHRPFMGDDLNPSTGWHAQFEDVNNDGLADLFIAKGNVDQMPDFAAADPNNLLLQRPDGTFAEGGALAGVASTAISRGAALADFNMDGLVDLVVVNRREPAQIWRNTGISGHWLGLALSEPAPNTAAIGAWIEVERGEMVMRREITSGGGHASGQLGWWHFGLGDLTQARVRVIWPDGTEGAWERLAADQFYTLSPGTTAQLLP